MVNGRECDRSYLCMWKGLNGLFGLGQLVRYFTCCNVSQLRHRKKEVKIMLSV